MTREEAIEAITRLSISSFRSGKTYLSEALTMAIQALQTEQLKESQENFNKDYARESMLKDALIRRQAVDDYISQLLSGYLYDEERERLEQFCAWLWDELPSVQPTQKVGHWEYMQYDANPKIGNWHCSECGRIVFLLKSQKYGETPLYDYCPWCGAKMEEGE
jgi:hypothetical protein